MHSFHANFRNELDKMWARRRTKGFLLLTVLLPGAAGLLLAFVPDRTGIIAGLGNNLPMLMLSLFTFSLFPLFIIVSAADSFSGETAARTLKLLLVRPITRSKAFASKVAAIAVAAAVQLALLWIASAAVEWVVSGAGGGLPDSLKAYAAAWLPMLAIVLIAALIAQAFNQPSGAIAMLVILYAAGKVIPLVFPQVSVWSPFSYTNWYVLWTGSGASVGKLANMTLLLLSYCIMAYTAGSVFFDRKQL